jgi:uncharacterized protein YjdB
LTATVLPDNATNKSVIWESSDNGIATVDATGLVTAIASGTAIVTVTTVDGGFTAQCTVTVAPQTGAGINTPATPVAIYPNPFTDYILVNTPAAQQISIYSASGQCVYERTLQAGTNRIDTSRLPNGVYLVKCGSERLKMVK